DAHFAVGLAQGRVGAAGTRQIVQELHDVRVRRAVDGRIAEAGERYDEAVELAAPVVHAVVAGVGDEHVEAVSAVGEVAGAGGELRDRGVVGGVVQPAVG